MSGAMLGQKPCRAVSPDVRRATAWPHYRPTARRVFRRSVASEHRCVQNSGAVFRSFGSLAPPVLGITRLSLATFASRRGIR